MSGPSHALFRGRGRLAELAGSKHADKSGGMKVGKTVQSTPYIAQRQLNQAE